MTDQATDILALSFKTVPTWKQKWLHRLFWNIGTDWVSPINSLSPVCTWWYYFSFEHIIFLESAFFHHIHTCYKRFSPSWSYLPVIIHSIPSHEYRVLLLMRTGQPKYAMYFFSHLFYSTFSKFPSLRCSPENSFNIRNNSKYNIMYVRGCIHTFHQSPLYHVSCNIGSHETSFSKTPILPHSEMIFQERVAVMLQ